MSDMSEALTTVSDIVKALGGAERVATMFRCGPNAVYNWTAANRLPAKTYLAIRDALASEDRSAPDHLWAMAPGSAPQPAAEPARAVG